MSYQVPLEEQHLMDAENKAIDRHSKWNHRYFMSNPFTYALWSIWEWIVNVTVWSLKAFAWVVSGILILALFFFGGLGGIIAGAFLALVYVGHAQSVIESAHEK